MADTSSLILKVDSRDVKSATNDLNNLSKSGTNAEKSTAGVTKSFSALNAVLTVGAVSAVAAQYIKLADTMTGVQSKLKLVTSSTNELATAQEELFKIAQKTRQGYAETVDTFSNFAVAMGDMGKSQKEILRVTETVNKAIAISGGTAQQAAAATMQLGQAFASGTLRGDELNSILENSKGLAQAIADGMGVPIGKLRQLGSEGKITAEILANALEKSAASVDEKFGKVAVTVSASVTTMENSLLKLVGNADQAMNGSGGIAEVFTYFAKSMDENNDVIIESGKDAFRALQVMGVGMIQLGTSFYQAGVAIPTSIALAIDAVTQLMENGINDMIGLAEQGTNKVKSLYGGDRVKLGRVDIDTNISKGLLAHYTSIVDAQENAIATQSQLFKDIMGNTTELKKIAPPSGNGGGARGGNSGISKGGKTKSEKEWYQDVPEMTKAFDVYDAMNTARNEKELYFIDSEKQAQIDKWDTLLQKVENFDEFYSSISNLQDSIDLDKDILSGWNDFGANLDGIAGKIGNVSKVFSDMSKNNQKFIAKDLDLQKKYAKAFIDAKDDEEKQKFAMAEFDNAQAKNKEQQQSAELAGYSALAGTIASAFEKGSDAAIAFTTLQSVLGIASSWTAIANAWALPFPANIPAVAMVASQVMPIIGQLGGSSGGGGVTGNSIASGNNFDYNRDMIESNYTPMTDRLDRQIELLESIDKNGSASQLGVSLAATSFQRDYALWVEDTLEKARLSATASGGHAEIVRNTLLLEGKAGLDVYKVIGSNISLNTSILRESTNLVKALQASLEMQWGTFGQGEVTTWDANGHQQMLSSIRNSLNEMQNLVQEWAMGVVESMDDLKDASADFKGYFDDVTGSMFYESSRLKEAYADVAKLSNGMSFSDYLQANINEIDALQKFFTDDTFALLMSDSFDDIEAQMKAINELSALTGETFEGGAREALNYLESIELVSEAMARSRENISSFTSSLMTSEAASSALASSLGETLATNVDGLSQMFFRLSNDMDGLTDADLELLNANLELLKNTDSLTATQDAYNESLQATQNSISTLNGSLGSIQSTIDKLRGAAGGADYTMDMFRQSMSTALSLSGSTNYTDFAKAAQDAAGYSSVLMDSSNFEFGRDQRFAQAVAANQFEALEKSTLSQIDYLKMIEENTRGQLEILSGSINNLSNSINNELLQAITNPVSGSSGIVKSAFEQVLGRTPDTTSAGFKYWTGAVDSGSISADILNQSIASGASSKEDVYAALDWFANDYDNKQEGRGLSLLDSSFSKGILSSLEAAKLFDEYALPNNSFASSVLEAIGYTGLKTYIDPRNISAFAVGTQNVPHDMIAKIHKGEAIVPAKQAETWRQGKASFGDNSEMVAELRYLRAEVSSMRTTLNESRDIQNESLVQLEYIGAVS